MHPILRAPLGAEPFSERWPVPSPSGCWPPAAPPPADRRAGAGRRRSQPPPTAKPAAADAQAAAAAARAGAAARPSRPRAAGQAGRADAKPAAAPAKATAPVTLVWDTFRGVGTPYPDELIKAFRAKQPNITIEFRPLPTTQTDSYPKLYTMYAAGNIGDLYSFDPVDYEFFRAVPQGLVKPLDDYIAADKYDVKQFYETYMDLQRLNGKVWGLPAWGHPGDGGIVVNEVALAEAGLKVARLHQPELDDGRLLRDGRQAAQGQRRPGPALRRQSSAPPCAT